MLREKEERMPLLFLYKREQQRIACSFVDGELFIDAFYPETKDMEIFVGKKFQDVFVSLVDETFYQKCCDVFQTGIVETFEINFNALEYFFVVISKNGDCGLDLIFRNISESKLFIYQEKLKKFLLEYTKNQNILFEDIVRKINKLVVESFDVSCCSLWMHYTDICMIECVDIYSQDSHRDQKTQNPFLFDEKDPYFQELLDKQRYLYRHTIKNDPIHKSICKTYIENYGIKYKYDIAIVYEEKLVAILCVENTKEKEFFTPVFEQFCEILKKDISILINVELKKELEAKFRAVEKNEYTGILIYRDRVLYVNDAVLKINGFTFEEMQSVKTWELFAPEYQEKFKNIIQRRMKGEQFPKSYSDVRVLSKSGKILTVRLSAETILYEGKYAGISIVMDITDIVEAREILQQLATTDVLTKIHNRRKINEAIDKEIDRFERYKEPFGLIMFDIDYFKNINDAYGHDIGDEVLVELSELVKTKIRKSDCFARWGGEEFLIMVRNIEENEIKKLAKILNESVQECLFSFQKIDLTISIGVTMYHYNDTKEEILRRVDKGLYRAKKEGRNRVVFL